MAALEVNSGQDRFSSVENGDGLPEEKSLSIDYSQDLWLANGEDSLGPYAQQPSKVLTNEPSCTYSPQPDVCSNYSDSFAAHQSLNSHSSDGVQSEFSEPQDVNVEGQVWSGVLPEREATSLQPATSYMNGLVEQNGMDFNSTEEEKNFAQLVPAGSYIENSGGDNQDKTFTSLMPAAVMGVDEEVQPEYSTMIGAHQQQLLYYSSGDRMNTDSTSPMDNHDSEAMSYDPSVQMQAVNEEESESQEDERNAVYISMNNLNGDSQTMTSAGTFAVLSPAMIRMTNSNSEEQSYNSHLTGSSYQHISTLPFVQNGAYASQTSFTTYHSLTSPPTGDSQHDEALQQSEYSLDHVSFTPDVHTTLTSSLQTNSLDYQEEDEEEDEEPEDQDMEEYSEFGCPVCGDTFLDQTALDDHVNNHPPLKTFVCETCSKGFATRRYLKYHRKNHCKRAGSYEGRNDLDENDPSGEVKRFTCNFCNRTFRVLKCMKVHKKKKHGLLKEYTCQNCAVTFNSLQEHSDHPCEAKDAPLTPQVIQYTPPPLVLPTQKKKKKLKNARPCCDICGKTFSDRISVDIHRVKHIEEELYPCDMCSEDEQTDCNHNAVLFRIRFFTDDNQDILEEQRAAVTNDQSRSEDGGSVSATPAYNPGSATPHSAPATPFYLPATPTHPPGTPVSAANSNSALDYGADVGVQLLEQPARGGQFVDSLGSASKNTDFPLTQPEVKTETSSASDFEVAQNSSLGVNNQSLHTISQELKPQQDPNTYSSNIEDGDVVQDASGSILAVTPKKKKVKPSKVHMCDICSKSFGDTSKLELHIKSNHLDDRPYQCDICEKSFFTKWKLQRHMLSHLEQKPHSCPMCSKSFVERGKLDAHYRTHLGTKPYKCDQCPKTFTVKSQLSIHQRRIHSSDQPFGCLVCGKAFLWKSGLEKHMRKHTKEKPFICMSCGMKYSNKANLIDHMTKAHNLTYVDP